jgi:cilia- and flagella-associated protein 52
MGSNHSIGDVINGLLLHPGNEHIIFSLGSTIIIRDIVQRTQTFLRGHDNEITTLAVSPNGKYIASGQKTHAGFQADIIVWDFHQGKMLYKLSMHKVRIESLCFSG